MTAYRVDDIPAAEDVFDVPAGVVVAAMYTGVTGALYGPTGTSVTLTDATFELGVDASQNNIITVNWGTATPFATVGLYRLAFVLTAAGKQLQLPSYPIVVESEDGWHTIASIADGWADVPWQDEIVYELLELAKEQVVAYAPVLVPNVDLSVTIPARYRKGQAMQARNLWTAAKVDPSNGQIGDDTFTIRPYPLDWVVKQILRPKQVLGFVG